jgi:hypothetical protein
LLVALLLLLLMHLLRPPNCLRLWAEACMLLLL